MNMNKHRWTQVDSDKHKLETRTNTRNPSPIATRLNFNEHQRTQVNTVDNDKNRWDIRANIDEHKSNMGEQKQAWIPISRIACDNIELLTNNDKVMNGDSGTARVKTPVFSQGDSVWRARGAQKKNIWKTMTENVFTSNSQETSNAYCSRFPSFVKCPLYFC